MSTSSRARSRKERTIARFHAWAGKRCIVASDYQARQLRDLGAGEIHELPWLGSLPPRRTGKDHFAGWAACRTRCFFSRPFQSRHPVEHLIQAFSQELPRAVLPWLTAAKAKLSKQALHQLEKLRRHGRLLEHGVADGRCLQLPATSSDHLTSQAVSSTSHRLCWNLLPLLNCPCGPTRVAGVAEMVEAEHLGWSHLREIQLLLPAQSMIFLRTSGKWPWEWAAVPGVSSKKDRVRSVLGEFPEKTDPLARANLSLGKRDAWFL